MTFDRFADQLKPVSSHGSGIARSVSAGVPGFDPFMSLFAGSTLGHGLYRIHDSVSGPKADVMVCEAFPELAGTIECFGFDWLGRQTALDWSRPGSDGPEITFIDPACGDAFEIPNSFIEFHNEILTDLSLDVLESALFEEWSALHVETLPLQFDQCVGFETPLFLGGLDDLDNMGIEDIEVYWSISGQLRASLADAPDGSAVSGVTIEDA